MFDSIALFFLNVRWLHGNRKTLSHPIVTALSRQSSCMLPENIRLSFPEDLPPVGFYQWKGEQWSWWCKVRGFRWAGALPPVAPTLGQSRALPSQNQHLTCLAEKGRGMTLSCALPHINTRIWKLIRKHTKPEKAVPRFLCCSPPVPFGVSAMPLQDKGSAHLLQKLP